jgi:hypothetical protein
MTPSVQVADGRRIRRWTRDTIITKIREWNDRYGEPPCSADWNPSLARWRAQEWREERYRDGIWPSTNAAKRPFGGSFDAAVRAAGLEPHRPGPRRRAAGAARPDVAQRAPLPPRSVDDELLVAAERVREAEARAAALERRLRAAERRAERAEQAVGEARRRARRASEREGRARRARDRVQVTERQVRELTAERVEELVADGEARLRAVADQAEAAARDALDARRGQRLAEARAADAEVRAEAAERLGAAAHAQLASDGTGAAWKAAREAEDRAATAERRARELAVLVCGEARRLTQAEIDALRAGGPSGPAVLAAALRDLGRARASGNGPALDAALTALASAAVRWRDRL